MSEPKCIFCNHDLSSVTGTSEFVDCPGCGKTTPRPYLAAPQQPFRRVPPKQIFLKEWIPVLLVLVVPLLLLLTLFFLVPGGVFWFGSFLSLFLIPVASVTNWILASLSAIKVTERSQGRLRTGDVFRCTVFGFGVGACTGVMIVLTLLGLSRLELHR